MSNGCLTGCSKQGEGFDFHPANAGRALQQLYPDRFNLGLGASNAAAKQPRGVRYEGPQPFMREDLARMRPSPTWPRRRPWIRQSSSGRSCRG